MDTSSNDRKIEFNNGSNLIKKFENESFLEKIPIVKLNESDVSEYPYITDENIKNNSTFIANLFDLNIPNNRSKVFTKK